MLAAEIWHWWIGVLITLGVIAGLVALIAFYLKAVTSKKYEPGSSKRRRQSADL
jgi:formate-dependent nitrite reductase membrane component NrfD